MERKGKKILAVVISIFVILACVSVVVLLNLEKVQEVYEDIFDIEGGDGGGAQDESEGGDNSGSSTPNGSEKPVSEALSRILSTSSSRSIGSLITVVSSDSEFFPLIGTPISIFYKGKSKEAKPLLINGDATLRFLEVYNASEIITIGDVTGITGDFSFAGNEKSASLMAANNIWSYSEGALIIKDDKEGYQIGMAATILASYLNIPVVVTNIMDKLVTDTLSKLGVSYTLVCGALDGYGDTYYLSSLNEVYDLCIGFLYHRFGKVSYITMTNPEDVCSTYGIPKISSLAPYLSSFREGLVLSCVKDRLPQNIFDEQDENIADTANDVNLYLKTDLEKLLYKLKDFGLYSFYVENSPFLAILGDPYSIPFYYFENPNPSMYPQADDDWVATDDYYGDLDNNPLEVELAVGRVLALSLTGVSALISRSLFYGTYMANWKADSPISDVKNAEWKSTAYAAKGDDWNGAIWVSTGAYWDIVNYLQNQGYTVYTTQRKSTGATISQEICCYYSSSNMIYVLAHGSSDGYQMTDGIDSNDVKNWELGPSVQVLSSCSAARTDVSDIENTISLTFIEVGENAYIGGTRTESGDADDLSFLLIQSIVGEDKPIGIAHRDAKNIFLDSDDSYEHSAMRALYGEPAFNPYQP